MELADSRRAPNFPEPGFKFTFTHIYTKPPPGYTGMDADACADDEPTLPSQEHSYSELCNDVVAGDVGEYILDEPPLPSQEQRNCFAAQLVAVPRHFRALYDTV